MNNYFYLYKEIKTNINYFNKISKKCKSLSKVNNSCFNNFIKKLFYFSTSNFNKSLNALDDLHVINRHAKIIKNIKLIKKNLQLKLNQNQQLNKIFIKLNKKIKILKTRFLKNEAFLLLNSMYFESWRQNKIRRIQSVNSSNFMSSQRIFFHCIENKFEKSFLKLNQWQHLEGEQSFTCFEVWKVLVNQFIEQGSLEEKKTGEKLKIALELGSSISGKLVFSDDMCIKIKEVYKKELKNNLLENPISISFFINQLVDEIVQTIDQLKPGDSLPLILGNSSHAILSQITCDTENEYSYKIFNTGDYVEFEHSVTTFWSKRTGKAKDKALPVIYEKLEKKVFTSHFIDQLINLYFQKGDDALKALYAIPKKTFFPKSTPSSNKGSLYNLQKYATCSFSCVEAFIKNFLSKEDFKKLKQLKISMSLENQNQLIHQLQDKLKEKGWQKIVNGKPRLDPLDAEFSEQHRQACDLLKIAIDSLNLGRFYSISEFSV